MKVTLHFSEGWNARDLPCRAATWKSVFALFVRRMKKEAEWNATTAILGERPRTISILFCGDVEMREYQREYRRLDRTTDVLSFPTRELVSQAEAGGQGAHYEGHLGDLIVSLEAVARAARRVRRPFEHELVEVVLHGGLHLLGLDHIGSSQAARGRGRRMKALQRELYREARRFIKPSDVRVRPT